MDEDKFVPAYYAVSDHLNEVQIANVQYAISITPVSATIITDDHQGELASKFSTKVHRSPSIEAAHVLAKQLAEETGQPVLIVGGADYFDAYYSDGTAEAIAPAHV